MANSDAIQVRKVTDLHANYSVQGEYEPGKFSLQLILDNGAKEAVMMPTAPDAKVLIKLFNSGDTIYFDIERGALVFNNV
ncbi:MAG: hypothetical protein ACR2KW_02965 [Rubrobacter sp.]